MREIINSIDNREIATLFWMLLVFAWCMTRWQVRESFQGLFRAVVARPIALLLIFSLAYLSLVTYVLYLVQFWTLAQLKITVLWFLFAGIPSLAAVSKISENPEGLQKAIIENFKLTLLLEFFVNLFKLPLLAEFIFVPFAALLGCMIGFAQGNEAHIKLTKFLNTVLALLGSALLAFSIYKATTDFSSVANVNTGRDFSLPILYNLAFMPMLWILVVYSAYERVFLRIDLLIANDDLKKYAKWELIISLRGDIQSLNQWFKSARGSIFNSREAIRRSIQSFKNLNNRS